MSPALSLPPLKGPASLTVLWTYCPCSKAFCSTPPHPPKSSCQEPAVDLSHSGEIRTAPGELQEPRLSHPRTADRSRGLCYQTRRRAGRIDLAWMLISNAKRASSFHIVVVVVLYFLTSDPSPQLKLSGRLEMKKRNSLLCLSAYWSGSFQVEIHP